MRRPAAQTAEAKLIAAAVRMFSARGYTAVGIREIARQAGVTIGALYHYAPSKEALFLRILTEAYEQGIAEIQRASQSADRPADRLVAVVGAHVRGEVDDRDLWAVTRAELRALTPEGQAEATALRDRYEAVWAGVLHDGAASGDFVLDDAVITRFSLIKMCNGVAEWYRPDGRLSLDEICAILARQALALVGCPRAAPVRSAPAPATR